MVKEAVDGPRDPPADQEARPAGAWILPSARSHYVNALQTVQNGTERYVLKAKDRFDAIDRIVREMLV